jgi:hypothetical protein
MAGQLQDALVEPVPNVTAKAAPTCHLPGRKSSICCRVVRVHDPLGPIRWFTGIGIGHLSGWSRRPPVIWSAINPAPIREGHCGND